jgi:hypothetical protein
MQTEETRALIKTYYETLPTGNRAKLAALFTETVLAESAMQFYNLL